MKLQELFGIRLPVIQAPMAGSQGSDLAIAVCNAGGLGSLPCAMLTPDGMRTELQAFAPQPTGRSTSFSFATPDKFAVPTY